MADNYFELRIKINPDMEDIISEICFENLPCEGVVLAEETYKDLEMISTTEGTLRVFLTENADVETVLNEQRELLKSRGFSDEELGSWEFTFDTKENEDWSKKWKEKWDVTHVSDRITIVPDWLEYSPHRDDEVIIRLEPGCAFGTGTHQTTQLCMKAMEKYLKAGDEVADIGTGSGILAICAMKFGAKSAYGCDNDETVIDVAIENARKNGITVSTPHSSGSDSMSLNSSEYPPLAGGSKSLISGRGKLATHSYNKNNIKAMNPTRKSEIFTSPLRGLPQGEGNTFCTFELKTADKLTKQYDFVMANILHNVLFDIMGDLKAIMKEGAYLSLSGILNEKRDIVLEAVARENLEVVEEMHQDQWVGFIVRR